jgi:hypothetical protein
VSTPITRRGFLETALACAGAIPLIGSSTAGAAAPAASQAAGPVIGLVSWSFRAYFRGDGPGRGRPGPVPIAEEKKFDLLDFPGLMKQRYGFTVLDLVNNHFASADPAYVEKLTTAIAKAGCRAWNVKIDLPGANISAAGQELRKESIRRNREWLDVASRIGSPHARVNSGQFTPGAENIQLTIDSYQELAEYAGRRNVKVVVENHGGVTASPNAVLQIIQGVKENIATGPDTHNFNEAVLFEGLRKIFPCAVTCDVKTMDIAQDGGHKEYDVHRAVAIGLEAAYKGPWNIEFVGRTQDPFEGVGRARDLLAKWLAAANRPKQRA